ncbi:MAG: carboxylating nicotinate-nucleotide diphosphorylase [Gemmatimonadales bacterium]
MTLDVRADAERLAGVALAEDGPRDITSHITVPPGAPGRGTLWFKSAGVLAGSAYAEAVARRCECACEWRAGDGESITPGERVGIVTGRLAGILRAERPLLNLLQRASGIATATRQYADAVAGTGARILHTRKTAPGLRLLDVSAVLAGGAALHRLELATTVMVKDNHWHALETRGRSLAEALAEARELGVTGLQVEVESEAQVRAACAAGATRLLIDNQAPETVRAWTAIARAAAPGIEIEATGGITLDNVRRYAAAGVDWISIGALTHSVRSADISLDLAPDTASESG